jgi:hypothetical protein
MAARGRRSTRNNLGSLRRGPKGGFAVARERDTGVRPASGFGRNENRRRGAGWRWIERWFGRTERALRELYSVRRWLEDANQTVDGLIEDIEHYEHDRAVQG